MTDHPLPPSSPTPSPELSDPADPTFDRYMAGRLSDAEQRVVAQRVDGRPEWRGLVAMLRHWLRVADAESPPDIDRAVRRLSAEITAARQAESAVAARVRSTSAPVTSRGGRMDRMPPVVPVSPRGAMWRGVAIGAAIAGIGVVAWGTRGVWRRPLAIVASRTYTTGARQQAAFELPDGSRAALAPASRMTFVSEASGARTVSLDGEAVFTVTHDPSHPFIVHAGPVRTTVLGTRFDVRHYAGDRGVQVAVVEGRVVMAEATGRRAPLTLAAGAVGFVGDSTALIVSADSAQQYLRWTTGQLVFHDVPAPDVLAAMTRWYGYRFRWADSTLAEHRLTTVLDTQSPSNALGTIKLLLNVDLTFDGDLVTLHPRRVAPTSQRDRRDPRARLIPSHSEVGR